MSHRGSLSSISSHDSSIFSNDSGVSASTMTTMMSTGTDNSYAPPTNGLPCEFVGYGRCDLIFALDDVENWIEHIINVHLRNKLPRKVFCWFCDEYTFDYKRAGGDRRLNFEQRMWHIRDHFMNESRTVHNIRPDHYLNTHLHENSLIGDDQYNSVRRYSEVPQPSYILDSNAPQEDWGTASGSRNQFVVTETYKEDRMHRRERRSGKHKR
ncbi:hypothetical protein F5B22DRAFT_279218 [Xylaria bambusicola]|uniref:uncharacterized protein n=1 Tax=Xylaria bambusicola TaxID=326684 RepID=UPI0020072D7F|nr:uncharacterized protein F5B22DRAFT_279218 [Xylaria bambusicola]KAI0513205.1 hypothetical protein F5B22DRAFT_279218 [Xylaria bambusicola]